MNPENGLTLEEITHEINTFVVAVSEIMKQQFRFEGFVFKGHETSALVISHTLLMLAFHPEVHQKVVDELQEVFWSADTTVDYNSLNKLVYLEMVLKEVMRLFPVLPIVLRRASDEFTICEKWD